MRRAAFFVILPVLAFFSGGCHSTNRSSPSSEQAKTGPAIAAPHASDSTDRTADTSAAVATNEATPSSDKRPLLACFGDSLTAGFGTDPGESYPDALQRDLDHAGYHYRVINEGISGNTTKDGAERVEHIVALHPALVVVEFGGNDGLRGLRIEDTRASLNRILQVLTTSGTKVALAGITLPPDYGQDYIRQFDAIYPELAKRYRTPLLPFLLQGVFGVDGMMQADRTHATAAGNEIVACNVLRLVQPMLKR